MGVRNMRDGDGQIGGGTEKESNKRYLDRGDHDWVREKSGSKETPRNPQA